MYHALYRKYRPQTFDDVIGQDSIVKVLKNSIKNHKFSHAYLFFGSRGVGKTSLSKIFARAVNCLDSSDGNPCGKCKNCMIASENQAVDILEIDAASNNGVDEIRELRNKINLVPSKLKFMGTSCCPSWSVMAKKVFPEFKENISMALTPMVLTARLIKKEHKDAAIVVVGPCSAKKLEASRKSVRSDVDFVLTFEELMGMFVAKEVDFNTLEAKPLENSLA